MVRGRPVESSFEILPFEAFTSFIKLEVSFPFHCFFSHYFPSIPGNDFFAVILSPRKQVE